MEFARQEYFWLLLAMPLVVSLWGIGVWHRRRMRRRFGNIENLEAISRISHSGHAWMRGALFGASLILMTLGLAYPRMVLRELRAIPTPTDLVFLLDISPSMYARDMSPSRLGRAEEIIQKFVVLKQPQDRYGLVVFNWGSAVLSYLTSDPQSILVYFDYLNQQDQPQPGTNMGAALTGGLKLLDQEEKLNPGSFKGRRSVFVLLSDGDDTAKQMDKPLIALGKAGTKVYTFGLGTANGAFVPLVMRGGLGGQVEQYLTYDEGGDRLVSSAEDQTLRQIAEISGAKFVRGENDQQVDQMLREILITGRPIAGYSADPVREDLYRYFLAAAFACLVAGIFL
jgi:Ca-activated chloride channel family protein